MVQSLFQIIISSPTRLTPYTSSIDSSLSRLGRALAGGNIETIARAVLGHQALREVVVHKVFSSIDDECTALCRRTEPTHFRKPPTEQLLHFNWSNYVSEMEAKSPLLLKLLRMIVSHSDSRNDHKYGDRHNPGICMAMAVLLKERNREMVSLQTYISLLLFTSNVQKQVSMYIQ